MAIVRIETDKIVDEASFHNTFKETFGFPNFYGNNMNAWIDCMSYLTVDDGFTEFNLPADEILILKLTKTEDFNKRLPNLFAALIECSADVNNRYVESNENARISFVFL